MSIKRVVITGATGAIGMALIEQCIREHMQVYVICRPDSARLERLAGREGIHLVLTSLERLGEAAAMIGQPCDIFFHMAWAGTTGAARNDMYLQNRNVEYTLNAVALAHKLGCTTFIGAGSQAEYGRRREALRADTPAFPETGYGMAKLCAGQMSRQLCKERGIRHIWARILSVYGPYDGPQSLVSMVIRKLLAGERVELTRGEQLWDYLYAKDAARMLYLLGKDGRAGHTYCLGSGKALALRSYVECICTEVEKILAQTKKTMGTGGRLETLLRFGEIPYADGQLMYLCADKGELEADIGPFSCVSFAEGIRETVAWHLGRTADDGR